jgi:hypothetical protein
MPAERIGWRQKLPFPQFFNGAYISECDGFQT